MTGAKGSVGVCILSTCLTVLTVGGVTAYGIDLNFIPLGDLAGGDFESHAFGVSADGTVVIGCSESSQGLEAFRWTQGGGMVGLDDLAGGGFESQAHAVSGDGQVVVGGGLSADGPEAFRWTAGGMEGLGDLEGGIFDSSAHGVSGDGSMVVGVGTAGTGLEAFRWTLASGEMVGLGDLQQIHRPPAEPWRSRPTARWWEGSASLRKAQRRSGGPSRAEW